MPPFQPNATVPVPAPTAPSSTGPAFALAIAAVTWSRVTWRPRMSLSVPSLVSPTSAFTERTFSLPGWASVQRTTASTAVPTDERVGEDDRRFDRAELLDLRRAGELAEGVADEHRAGDLVLEEIAAVRQDRRHAGADGVALDERTCPTRTPATSVMALRGPGVSAPGAIPRSRARGRVRAVRRNLRRRCDHATRAATRQRIARSGLALSAINLNGRPVATCPRLVKRA